MKCFVCTSFLLSTDGVNSVRLEKGDVVDIPDHMAKGLVFEGYVKKYIEQETIVDTTFQTIKETKIDGRKRRG